MNIDKIKIMVALLESIIEECEKITLEYSCSDEEWIDCLSDAVDQMYDVVSALDDTVSLWEEQEGNIYA